MNEHGERTKRNRDTFLCRLLEETGGDTRKAVNWRRLGKELAFSLSEMQEIVPPLHTKGLLVATSDVVFITEPGADEAAAILSKPENSTGYPPISDTRSTQRQPLMGKDYSRNNIRDLLMEGFSEEELRDNLCFDVKDFQPLSKQLPRNAGQDEVVQKILNFAFRKLKVEQLLEWAKNNSPARYEKHQPYYVENSGIETGHQGPPEIGEDALRRNPELYERRQAIFDALMEIIYGILRDTVVSREELSKFIRVKDKGYFLFEQEITEYLQEISSSAVALNLLNTMLQNENLPIGLERTTLARQQREILAWFIEQVNVSRGKFSKYLSLK